MVSSGQRLLPLGGPSNGSPTRVGAAVETVRLSELLARDLVPGARRADCHVIILATTGQGTHGLDFVPHACRPGTLLWGRPGQVHQFGGQTGFDATVLAFGPLALPELPELRHLLDDPFTATCWQPAGEDEEAVVAEMTQIAVDCVRYADNGLGATLIAHELAVLLLRIVALAPPPPRGPATAVLGALRAEMERDVSHRRVEDYAETLRCSVRTLTRACLAVTGRSAKRLIDERVALEAKRLLATSALPVAEVGRRLGFAEPTNFGRFFAREAGQSPGAFRATTQAVRPPGVPHQRSSLPGRLAPRPGG